MPRLGPGERAKIGAESIVADDQFVELPAGANVLIIENGGGVHGLFAHESEDDEFHQFSRQGFGAGEKIDDGSEAVFKCPSA